MEFWIESFDAPTYVNSVHKVLLREATRRAGVAPNAAYRHFANREALLHAVREVALGEVARAMENHLKKVPRNLSPEDKARASLRAVGKGYLRFAQAQPGLFQTAFSASDVLQTPPGPARRGEMGLSPFKLLGMALDQFTAAGLLPSGRRAGAEVLAWSAVHGLAMLVIDGPMGKVLAPHMRQFEDRLLEMVEKGLLA
ncbi:TetR/AcrR family transcriptional regulator [soil metagenome]